MRPDSSFRLTVLIIRMTYSRINRLILAVVFLVASTPSIAQSSISSASWNFEEGLGTTILDQSGNGNNGLLNGGVTWTSGIQGLALQFAGGSDQVLVADSPSLDVASAMSIAVWLRPDTRTTQYVIKKARANQADGYELSLSSSGVFFVRFNQDSSSNTFRLNSVSRYPTDGSTWMHVAAIFDGTQILLYINGVLESTLPAQGLAINNNDLPLSIGSQDDGARPYQGAMDELSLFDHAIDEATIQILALIAPPTDTDGDGVPDASDAFPLDPTEWLDADGDGIGDNADLDDDNDGMPDDWEMQFGFDPFDPSDAAEDADGDGVTNLEEFQMGTPPLPVDTDGDGFPDAIDAFPLDPTEWLDADGDGIGDNSDLDDDNDGMPDDWEMQFGFDPLDPSDAAEDADGDGVTNLEEFQMGTSPLPAAVASGIWDFEEGFGTAILDQSGNGNNGILSGGVTWTGGIQGLALQFSGGSDRVLVADSPSLDVADAMSIAVWLRPDVRTTQYAIKKAVGSQVSGYEVSLSSSGVIFVRFNQDTSGNAFRLNSVSRYPTDGTTWMHVAAVFDGTQISLYINGVQESTLPAQGLVINNNDLPLSIGAQDDGARPYQGAMDELSIFDHAIDEATIQILALIAPPTDTDGDGVPDASDAFPLDPTEWLDADGDGIGDNADLDDDNDGMPDDWEIQFGFNPFDPSDAAEDADGDGVSNVEEFQMGTPPLPLDTDGDGFPDAIDAFPLDPTEWLDADADGIGNNADLDDDNDGMPDAWELQFGFDPFNAADAAEDADGDGFTNLEEFQMGTPPLPAAVASGLWSFEEGFGTEALDQSGNGNDGILNGGVTWSSGIQGLALQFAGGSDQVLVADSPSLDVADAMSIAVWLHPNVRTTQYVIKKARNSQVSGYELSLSSSGVVFVRFNQADSGNTYRLNSVSSYPTDSATWMHAAAVFDGTQIFLYINGVLESTLPAQGLVINNNDLPLSIGAQDDGARPYQGAMDELVLFDHAIDAATIANLVNIEPQIPVDGISTWNAENLQPFSSSSGVGEKPQSKVWSHDNQWWMVMPDDSATYLWRLDSDVWTRVLLIYDLSTTSQSDVLVSPADPNVVHVLVFDNDTSQLVSMEYIAGAPGTYQLWSARPLSANVVLPAAAETATIAVDSVERMWLAYESNGSIEVRYSSSPYSDWTAAPVILASGVNSDDIAAVTSIDSDTIGVMWSNQNTDLFGFRTHVASDGPSIWSIDEVPASQSAAPGMADDHINMVVASDGTLYAAIKTSFNNNNLAAIALLVRSPAGIWEDLHFVDNIGTRPIVLLNEVSNALSIIYSDSDSGTVLYQETALPTINFAGRNVLFASGNYSNLSSLKSTYSNSLVVLASGSSSSVASVRLSDP